MRKQFIPTSTISTPSMKSPLQLEQWAAYEAITAKRAQEAEQSQKTKHDATALMSQANDWKTGMAIREFVAATMANVSDDSSPEVLAEVAKWQEWALNVANHLDHTKLVAVSFASKASGNAT